MSRCKVETDFRQCNFFFIILGLTEVNVLSVEEINFLFSTGNRNLTKINNGSMQEH